jgi:hypothetical protein
VVPIVAAVLVLTLIALAVFALATRSRPAGPQADPSRRRPWRGRALFAIVLVLFVIGGLEAVARERDGEKADRAAKQREAAMVAKVNADPDGFLSRAAATRSGFAVEGGVPIHSLKAEEGSATVQSQVDVGRAHRCVVLTVRSIDGTTPPRSRIARRRCFPL